MTLARLAALARPHRAALLLLMALTLAESLAFLALPWLGGRFAGAILGEGDAALGPLAGLLLLALALAAALRALVGVISGRTTARLLAALRRQVHGHLQALPLSFHQGHTQGNLLALSTHEIARLGDFLSQTLVSLPSHLLTAGGAAVLMAGIDPTLALVVPTLVPVYYLVLRVLGRRLRRLGHAFQEAEAAVVAVAGEDLAMLPATKAFTREEAAARRFAERTEAASAIAIRSTDIYAVLGPALNLVAGTAAVALLVLLGQGLREGEMTPAEMVSFLLYAAVLTQPVARLAQVYGRIQSARGTLARLSAVLDAPPEPGRDAPPRPGRARGEIAFEDVHFAYEGREPALRGVSLTLRPGETVALTGPNGAGKSTLAALLLRFVDPVRGSVRLDGTDLREMALGDLRRQIGFVPQRPLLFDGTIGENIGFGREGATQGEIEAAARLAQAHDFIRHLPEGYATRVGENGVRLSGGQGQRIALARALLKDPPVLILDEATSMYDLDAEGAFVASVARGLSDRTVILITHRPATLALARRVVTLESGRVAAVRDAA